MSLVKICPEGLWRHIEVCARFVLSINSSIYWSSLKTEQKEIWVKGIAIHIMK